MKHSCAGSGPTVGLHSTRWLWVDSAAAACNNPAAACIYYPDGLATEVRPYFISRQHTTANPQRRSTYAERVESVEVVLSTYADTGGARRTNIFRAQDADHTEHAIVGATGQTKRLPCRPPPRDTLKLPLPPPPTLQHPHELHSIVVHRRRLNSQDHLTSLSTTLHCDIERSDERLVFALSLRRAKGSRLASSSAGLTPRHTSTMRSPSAKLFLRALWDAGTRLACRTLATRRKLSTLATESSVSTTNHNTGRKCCWNASMRRVTTSLWSAQVPCSALK